MSAAVAGSVAAALTLSLFSPGPGVPSAQAVGSLGVPAPEVPVEAKPVAAVPAPVRSMPAARVSSPVWPGKAKGTVAMPVSDGEVAVPGSVVSLSRRGTAAAPARVSTPVTDPGMAVTGAQVPRAPRPVEVPAKVSVEALGADVASRLGGHGVAFTLTRADAAAAGPGRVAVRVDASGFARAFGGGFASRLRLVRVPRCALDLARVGAAVSSPDCAWIPEPVEAVVDPLAGTVSADLTVDAPASLVPGAAAGTTEAAPSPATTPSESSASGLGAGEPGPAASPSPTEPPSMPSPTPNESPSELPSPEPSPSVASPVEPSTQPDEGAVYVVSAGPSGSEGTFTATPLTVAGSWSVGLQSGSFNWSSPIPMAPALTGDVPSMSLQYDSSSVDGMTAGDNSQASQQGIGWGLSQAYIERVYRACSQDGHSSMGDLCWDEEHYRLVMDGQSSELVEDTAAVGAPAGSRVFRTRQDGGLRLEAAASGSSTYGDNDGEYWRVYETDGTLNVFGRGFVQYAGQAADATNSVWTVPVFGDDAGEPCHQSTLAASWCQQAWRWNLDSVLDRHNGQTAYVYANEVNRYRLQGASDVLYDRGGFLTRVDYSSRYLPTGSEAARSRTSFTFEPRCSQRATGAIVGATPACASLRSGQRVVVPGCADGPAVHLGMHPEVPVVLLALPDAVGDVVHACQRVLRPGGQGRVRVLLP